MTNRRRQAKARVRGLPAKVPRATQPSTTADTTPVFSFRFADRSTSGAWRFQPSADDACELFDFLCEMGRLKWSEIERQNTGGRNRRSKHHSQPLGSLTSGAQSDLRKRKLDETFGDEMFRFRLSGTKRLWGFRDGQTFHVVWWDPDHAVYPTEPS